MKAIKSDELLEFIKSYLSKANGRIYQDISSGTDLVSLGVESIVILELMSDIESHYGIKLTLSQLEKFQFKISADSLAQIIE